MTPLVFSVSTLPHRSAEFDPARLRFEQHGRIWQPAVSDDVVEVLPLDENAKFGGKISGGEMRRGLVLLPAWMNPQEPIMLRYDDFHCLARFDDRQAKTASAN